MRSSLIVLSLALSSTAFAFDDSGQFFAPMGLAHAATLGASAEGIYFTGAPRYSGLDCSACHTDGPHHVGLELATDDGTLFSTGYRGGQTYALVVSLTHETEGLEWNQPTCTEVPGTPGEFTYVQCNNNNFALEIDDVSGPVVGGFCAAPPVDGACPKPDADADESVVAPDNDAVFANRAHSMSMPYELLHNDVTQWALWWTAPAALSGPLTIYVAAVDGNGGSGTPASDQDPYGDDTVHAAFTVGEAGVTSTTNAHGGCSMAGASHASPWLVFVVLLVFARRRLGALALLLLVGCDGNSPNMLPGERCYPCHAPQSGGGGGHRGRGFSVAGTVFPNAAAPPMAGLVGITVTVTDSTGQTASMISNEVGNFYTEQTLTPPLSLEVSQGTVVRHMEPTVTTGDCASCHSQPPEGSAEGRVHLPVSL